jgi:transmembrane sensor
MKNFNLKLVEKYLSGETTTREAKEVLEWFDTPEGKYHLENELDSDIADVMASAKPDSSIRKEPDSEGILSRIYHEIDEKERTTSYGEKPIRLRYSQNNDRTLTYLKIAASFLVLISASIFYFYLTDSHGPGEVDTGLRKFITEAGEQKQIRLGDGTTIQLNSNSELQIPENFLNVSHDPDNVFSVHTKNAVVEVLGTAFNVKSYAGQDDVQVSVLEGTVSFKSNVPELQDDYVVLRKGCFGHLNLSNNELTVEDFGAENYLVWMNGRLVFDSLELDKVCTQLARLYQVECRFEDNSLKNMQLTADFSHDSLEKTISVIALSLDIDYQISNDDIVTWTVNAIGSD